MLLTILGFLCGIVLSFRFDVLILLPAILLGWALATVGELVIGGSGMSVLIAAVLVTTALQVGYVAGIVAQWALRLNRVNAPQNWSEKPAGPVADSPV